MSSGKYSVIGITSNCPEPLHLPLLFTKREWVSTVKAETSLASNIFGWKGEREKLRLYQTFCIGQKWQKVFALQYNLTLQYSWMIARV